MYPYTTCMYNVHVHVHICITCIYAHVHVHVYVPHTVVWNKIVSGKMYKFHKENISNMLDTNHTYTNTVCKERLL